MQILGHNVSNFTPLAQTSPSTPCIRRATPVDVPAIVQLQTICQPHFHLTDPGAAFLRSFYSFVLHDHRGTLFVSEQDHKLAGFVAGFSDPSQLYERVASQKLRIFATAFGCLARHPIQLPKFLGDVYRASHLKYAPGCCSETACELVAVAVQPRLRLEGHGKALILALAEVAKRSKMDQLRVHIDSNDAGMASFYRKLGFHPFRAVRASDTQWLHEYVLTIYVNGKVT